MAQEVGEGPPKGRSQRGYQDKHCFDSRVRVAALGSVAFCTAFTTGCLLTSAVAILAISVLLLIHPAGHWSGCEQPAPLHVQLQPRQGGQVLGPGAQQGGQGGRVVVEKICAAQQAGFFGGRGGAAVDPCAAACKRDCQHVCVCISATPLLLLKQASPAFLPQPNHPASIAHQLA